MGSPVRPRGRSRRSRADRAGAAGAAEVYARIGSRPDEAYARLEAGRRLLAIGATRA